MEERKEGEESDPHCHPTCFLCLKLSPLPNLKEEEPISLKTIHRYLNLPSGDGGGCGGVGAGEDLVWWWLCEQCALVTGKLTDLCEQLEVIQMKVNHSLELFYSKLLEGEEELEHRPHHHHPRNYKRSKSFHKVRAQTLEQCERSLRHAKRLLVHLKKVQVARRSSNRPRTTCQPSHSISVTPVPPPPCPVVIKTEPEPMVQEEQGDNDDPEEDFSEPVTPKKASSSTAAIRTSTRDSLLLKFLKGHGQPSPPTSHPIVFQAPVVPSLPSNPLICPPKLAAPSQVLKCSSCPPDSPVFMSKPEVDRHLEEFHLDQLFPSSNYRHPRMPPIEYKAYCEHVVHTELLLSTAKYTDGSSPFKYFCLYCQPSIKCHFDTWRHLRAHLLQNHINMLAGKLWELQRCTEPEELRRIRLPPLGDDMESSTPSPVTPHIPVIRRTRGGPTASAGLDLSGTGKCCPDCGAEFARRNLVKRHQIESCVFRRDKSKSSRKPTECPDCGVTFLHPGSFYHHRKEKHPHKAATSTKMQPTALQKNWNSHFL